MKKSELIEKIKSDFDVDTAPIVESVINKVFDTITSELAAGNEVAIKNFGVFKISERKEHDGPHPRTGEKIHISAYKLPVFKASSIFKKAVD